MKIWSLRTHSLSCDPIIEPLRRLGHNVREVCYFQPGVPFDASTLPGMIADQPPDAIVMLGQHDEHTGKVPPPGVLAELASRWPFIHICCDGSERVWWEQLYVYKAAAPSMVHVNIDGVADGFFAEHGWTTLCPLDHETFIPYAVPWDTRPISVGFCGGWGAEDDAHPRAIDMHRLIKRGLVAAVKRPFPDYGGFQQFMGTCKAVYNHAATGTADHMHVKARVLEAAFAGALVLEPAESPAREYFGAGLLPYADDEDIALWKEKVESGCLGKLALEFREKAIGLYSAEQFWPKAFRIAGIA
jgi:hypothetical protein